MKNNKLPIIGILLVLSIGNFSRMNGMQNIRAVDFLSIFAIGLLTGALISELVKKFKNKA